MRAVAILDVEFAVDRCHPLFHIVEAIPEFSQLFEVDANTVVVYFNDHIVLNSYVDAHDGALRVLQHIV